MDGMNISDLADALKAYEDKFEQVAVGHAIAVER